MKSAVHRYDALCVSILLLGAILYLTRTTIAQDAADDQRQPKTEAKSTDPSQVLLPFMKLQIQTSIGPKSATAQARSYQRKSPSVARPIQHAAITIVMDDKTLVWNGPPKNYPPLPPRLYLIGDRLIEFRDFHQVLMLVDGTSAIPEALRKSRNVEELVSEYVSKNKGLWPDDLAADEVGQPTVRKRTISLVKIFGEAAILDPDDSFMPVFDYTDFSYRPNGQLQITAKAPNGKAILMVFDSGMNLTEAKLDGKAVSFDQEKIGPPRQ